jgi:hypothetical protein
MFAIEVKFVMKDINRIILVGPSCNQPTLGSNRSLEG